jgi:hypothetical protein
VVEPGTQDFAADKAGSTLTDDLVSEPLAGRDIGPRLDPRRVAESIALGVEAAQRSVLTRRRIVARDDEVDYGGCDGSLSRRR